MQKVLENKSLKLLFGWIAVLSCSALAEDWAVVKVSSIDVREEPGGTVIGAIHKGQHVAIMEYSGEWAYLDFISMQSGEGPRSGWVKHSLLTILEKRNYTGTKDCEVENRSGAEVCLTIYGSSMRCDEDYDEGTYEDCDVEVNFRLESDYKGNTRIDVRVDCDVRIKFREQGSSYWLSDTSSDSIDIEITSSGTNSGHFEMGFRFGLYKKVVEVKIESVDCRIYELDLQ